MSFSYLLLKVVLENLGEAFRGFFCVSGSLYSTKILFPFTFCPPPHATLCMFSSTCINRVCCSTAVMGHCEGPSATCSRDLQRVYCPYSIQYGQLKIVSLTDSCPFLFQVHSLLCLPLPWVAVNSLLLPSWG